MPNFNSQLLSKKLQPLVAEISWTKNGRGLQRLNRRFALDRQKRDRKSQIALTEKQMKIIEYIQRYGQMSSGDVAKMFTLTRQTALKQLSKLVELEVIKLEGKGRGAHHVLV